MKHLKLTFSSHTCEVFIGQDTKDYLTSLIAHQYSKIALIGDEQVIKLHGSKLAELLKSIVDDVEVVDFPAGEKYKTRQTKQQIEDFLQSRQFDRTSCVVALGGGISMDIAGFVAATYMRGIAHIAIPTSLLAQVDAALGGKTGVNTPFGKNLIGAFHQPRGIIINKNFLQTLPKHEYCNGFSEIIKHAVIADSSLFEWMESHTPFLITNGIDDDVPLIRCAEIKAHIVLKDETEAHIRSILNFGHTIGHAIELAGDHALSHGEAVAVGMIVEGMIACSLCGFPFDDFKRLRALIHSLVLTQGFLPYDFSLLIPFIEKDKKSIDGKIHLPLPTAIGTMANRGTRYTVPVERSLLEKAWQELL